MQLFALVLSVMPLDQSVEPEVMYQHPTCDMQVVSYMHAIEHFTINGEVVATHDSSNEDDVLTDVLGRKEIVAKSNSAAAEFLDGTLQALGYPPFGEALDSLNCAALS